MDDLEQYWQVVQRRVCAKCIDSDGHGECRLKSGEECALRLYFPKIVETVLSVQSDTLAPYVEALRSSICSGCKHQSADGTCAIRTQLDCGLDRYYPLIIEAIEELRAEGTGGDAASGDKQ